MPERPLCRKPLGFKNCHSCPGESQGKEEMPLCPNMLNSTTAAGCPEHGVLADPRGPCPTRPSTHPRLQLCRTPAFNITLILSPTNKKAFPASRFSANLKASDADSYRATTSPNAEVHWCQRSPGLDASALGCSQALWLSVSLKEQIQAVPPSTCSPLLLQQVLR